MQSNMTNRYDNDVTHHKGVMSMTYDTELSKSIKKCMIYGKDETAQRHDRLYRFNLGHKWNWTIMINPTQYDLWWRPEMTTTCLIVQVQSTPKSKLIYHDRSNMMWYIMKSKQDNDTIDRTSVISVKYDIEMSILIGQCAVYDEKNIGQQCDCSYRCGLCQNW